MDRASEQKNTSVTVQAESESYSVRKRLANATIRGFSDRSKDGDSKQSKIIYVRVQTEPADEGESAEEQSKENEGAVVIRGGGSSGV